MLAVMGQVNSAVPAGVTAGLYRDPTRTNNDHAVLCWPADDTIRKRVREVFQSTLMQVDGPLKRPIFIEIASRVGVGGIHSTLDGTSCTFLHEQLALEMKFMRPRKKQDI